MRLELSWPGVELDVKPDRVSGVLIRKDYASYTEDVLVSLIIDGCIVDVWRKRARGENDEPTEITLNQAANVRDNLVKMFGI